MMIVEDIIFKLLLAVVIGGIIGYEREYKNMPAGFRTHILVCIGTTLVSLIQLSMAEGAINTVIAIPELAEVIKIDYARLGAQAITGIGFLGAGTIIHSKGAIRGLTTAASLWVVGTLGLAIGMGYYTISILGATFTGITLVTLKKFQKRFITRAGESVLEIKSIEQQETMKYIYRYFNTNDIKIVELERTCIEHKIKDEINSDTLKYTISMPKYIEINEIINNLIINDNIKSVRMV